MTDLKEKLRYGEFLRQNGRLEESVRMCNEVLNEKLDDPEAIFLFGRNMISAGKYGIAHTLYMQFLRLKPNVAAGWNNLGYCYQEAGMMDEAERCFRRTLKLEADDSTALTNLGLIHLNRCETQAAIEYGLKSLKLNPESHKTRHNLGMAYLMESRWKEGWENFEASVGYDFDRNERCYKDEPRWDGEKGKVVVAYGEQGLGDEISFASCIPDLIDDCKETVVECDERLQGLFARSFPKASVYGTRYKETIDWMDRHKLDGRIAFGSLPKHYRNRTEDFPGTPYLVADPERRIQWRALLASISDKPKIGISWQGGMIKTGKLHRSVSLEAMMPILRQDATFVSLQYRDAMTEVKQIEEMYGIQVHHWPRAIEARDYDETAALVAELDMVISVTTAVIHLSGALGVPCLVLTPRRPRWFYGMDGESLPWYKSVQIIRQKKASDWLDPINEAAYRLRTVINGKRNGDIELHGVDERSRRVA